MNDPKTPPRMTSLDRKIDAARKRAERERAQLGKPTDGLTSQLSTPNNDVPLKREQNVKHEFTPDGVRASLLGDQHDEDILQAIAQLNAQDADLSRRYDPLHRMPPRVQKAIADGSRTISSAMAHIRQALWADTGYANSWHANLAMAFYDAAVAEYIAAGDEPESEVRVFLHKVANDGAARFMRTCFHIDTSDFCVDKMKPEEITVYGVGVWDRALSNEEMAQAQAYLDASHGEGFTKLMLNPESGSAVAVADPRRVVGWEWGRRSASPASPSQEPIYSRLNPTRSDPWVA